MSMNNGILIRKVHVNTIAEDAGFKLYEAKYQVCAIPCMDNSDMVVIKEEECLENAIRFALEQEYEYGIFFSGF